MKITHILNSKDESRKLSSQELQIGQKILRINLGYQDGESIVIVTDAPMFEKASSIWFEAAKSLEAPVEVISLEGMTHSGEEPPTEVVSKCEQADIIFLHTSFSLTHTQAGKVVANYGRRGVSLPTVDYDLIMRTLTLDYTPIHALGEQIKDKLNPSSMIRITSPEGTDVTAQIRQGKVANDGGILLPGEIGNLPAGEVFFAPVLGSMNGTIVIDASLADIPLTESVIVTVKDGLAVDFSGGPAAQIFKEKLSQFGEAGRNAAEVGIGTNPQTNPRGELIEAEKAYGTVHLAFGNSSAIGGEVNVPIHLDGVLLHPKIEVDGEILLENGQFSLK